MFAVFKREFKAYLCNLYGVVFMAIVFCAVNVLITSAVINTRLPGIEYALYWGSYVLAVAVPILCARSMAEDRKRGTDRFYRSLPISPAAVVIGKYLALLAVLAIPTAVFALYPVLLGAFGTVQYGNAYLMLLFFFLVGAALIALCQFLSSLTKRPWLSCVFGLLASVVLCLLTLSDLVLPEGTLRTVLQSVTPIYHMEDLAQYGIFNLHSLGVLLLYPTLFVFLTVLVSGGRRVRTVAVGSAVLAVVIAANVLLPFLPIALTQHDTDKTSLVGIPQETEQFLDGLEEDVTIFWLCTDNVVEDTLLGEWFVRLLERYADESEHLTVKRITDAEEVASFEEYGVYNYDMVITSERRTTVLGSGELFGYSSTYINQLVYDGEEMVFSAEEMGDWIDLLLSYYPEEEENIQMSIYVPTCTANAALTAALDYVTAESTPRPYLLTGFAGSDLPSGLRSELNAYDPETLTEVDISTVDAIPADAGCVILHAPTSDLGERETQILSEYLSSGGSLLLTTSPETWADSCPNLQSLLTPYGLTALSGIVFDSDEDFYVSSTSTLVPTVNQSHSLYNLYSYDSAHRMPWSHAIEISSDANAISIFSTSDSAIRKTAGGLAGEVLGNKSQYSVAAHAVRDLGDGASSQVIWFGSASAFADSTAGKATVNYLYYIDSIELLRGEYDSAYLSSVPSVSLLTEPMDEMSKAGEVVFVVALTVLIPLATLALGTVVWFRRRRRV